MDDARSQTRLQQRKVERLKKLIKKHQASLHSQSALLELSEQASKVSELTLLYPAIQQILESHLPCKNFYVVLLNPDIGELELTYFVDEIDGIELPLQAQKSGVFENSLTSLVFKSKQTKVFTKKQIEDCIINGVCQVMGTPCMYWLGVPIRHEGQVIGVMATQSYDANQPFSDSQVALFETVAFYFSTAVERVKKRQYMTQQVNIRTEQLRCEVARNQDTIRKQNILYAISKLATTSFSDHDFFQQVHEIINEEVFAKNLFIALLDDNNNEIYCPYSVDEMSQDYGPRKFSKGLTEFVITSGKTEIFDQNRILMEVAKGTIELPKKFNNSPLPTSWIGVPLYHRQGVIGILACQAFNNEYTYKQSDIELISFVSEQISNVVVKHLADSELEQRVKEKTAELQQANIHLKLQIEERKKVEQQLFHDAHHDNLTGLANRSLFLAQLDKTLQRHLRDPSHCFAVMFIDLDNFKSINDNLGHHAGDKFLKLTAEQFSSCIREHDLLARFGGDEFVILLTHLQHEDEAIRIAERIVSVMETPFCIKNQCIQSGASIGIASSNSHFATTDDIIRDADSAMYAAKKAGKGTIKLSNLIAPEQTNIINENILNSAELSLCKTSITSLESGNVFATYYKAMLDLGAGINVNLESQLEKQSNPQDYSAFVAKHVLPHLEQDRLVFINVHPCVLGEGFDEFKTAIRSSHLDVCWLINNSALSQLSALELNNLKTLQELGYKIGISDVASHQLDLVKLTALKFDYYVLEQSFCRQLINEPVAQSQLAALLAMTRHLGTELIATGPAIVNYQAALQSLGLSLFLSQIAQHSEQKEPAVQPQSNAFSTLPKS